MYLINKIIFSEDQIEILLQQIFIFCIHSQYNLLDVAMNIIKENFDKESLCQITVSFIVDLNQYDSLEGDTGRLDHF